MADVLVMHLLCAMGTLGSVPRSFTHWPRQAHRTHVPLRCCVTDGSDSTRLSTFSVDSIDGACSLLAEYDAGHRAAAASPGAKGLGGALTANEWAAQADRPALAAAVRTLWRAAAAQEIPGRIMLGICASDAMGGVAALKAWVTSLELPKGPLHGMDDGGVPVDTSTLGAVYIKYNSLPGAETSDPAGTARLSGYGGDFRGVYFAPSLDDGEFRQYAVLPLDLFGMPTAVHLAANDASPGATEDPATRQPTQPAPRVLSEASGGAYARSKATASGTAADGNGPLSVESVEASLEATPAYLEVRPLGVSVAVVEVSEAEGAVRLRCEAPRAIRRAIEMRLSDALRGADQRIKRLDFAD